MTLLTEDEISDLEYERDRLNANRARQAVADAIIGVNMQWPILRAQIETALDEQIALGAADTCGDAARWKANQIAYWRDIFIDGLVPQVAREVSV